MNIYKLIRYCLEDNDGVWSACHVLRIGRQSRADYAASVKINRSDENYARRFEARARKEENIERHDNL